MRTVKIDAERSIDIRVTLGVILRVKAETGIDLTMPFAIYPSTNELPNPEGLSVVAAISGADYAVVVAVMYYAAERSLREHDLGPEDFADLLDGPILAAAHDALLEEWHDFSHGSNRTDTAKAIRAAINVQTATVTKAGMAMDQAESKGLTTVEQNYQKTLASIAAEFPSATASPG